MIGIGHDIVDVERFRAVLARRPTMTTRLFSATERADLADRHDPVPGFAARFAAKEAVMKALGVGLGSVGFGEIEVVTLESGAPSLRLSGRASLLAEKAGAANLQVSLTHTGSLASAVVVLS